MMPILLGPMVLGLDTVAANDALSPKLATFAEIHFEPVMGVRPFFLAGTDALSIEWVSANANFFRERSAVGYVIDASSSEALETLRSKSGYRLLLPLEQPGTLAREYGLRAYPVFVDPAEGVAIQ
jgi:integrating conjugative element protein (TIGR03765 family)